MNNGTIIETLRDGRGIYGFRVNASGLEFEHSYLVRADKAVEQDQAGESFSTYRLMHSLPRNGWYNQCSFEAGMARLAAHEHLERSGVYWKNHYVNGFDLDDSCEYGPNEHYRATMARYRAATNARLKEALAAADPEALCLARGFRPRGRFGFYLQACRSERSKQLVVSFPVLVAMLRRSDHRLAIDELVDAGAPLKEVAAAANVPMCLRKVLPGAVGDVGNEIIVWAREHEYMVHAYLPKTTPAQKRFLIALGRALRISGPFVEWVARNFAQMPGRRIIEVEPFVENIGDWVKASYRQEYGQLMSKIPSHLIPRNHRKYTGSEVTADYITRMFQLDMSLRTVVDLSDEWHEAVANSAKHASVQFPEPWTDSASINGYLIDPITNGADLHREGSRMRHCVSSHAESVVASERYIYHMSKDDKPIATIELLRGEERPMLGQVRGPCNALLDGSIIAVVRKWFGQAKMVVPARPSAPDDDDIPF